MSWLEKNSYIKILFIVSLLIIVYIYITEDRKTTYEPITIQYGDTLWTLAERYKGDMSKEEWIHKVILENNLQGEHITAGETLMIPIPRDDIYIAINNEENKNSTSKGSE